MNDKVRLFALIGVVGAVWSLVFAGYSTVDYASHLDRGLHDLHCSLIPGAPVEDDSAGCRAALNSPYAAVFKHRLWGGIPISLFGFGCFAFLLAHAVYVAVKGRGLSLKGAALYALLALSPLAVSAVMLAISWFKLGTICKTCAGIYIGSLVMAISGVGVAMSVAQDAKPSPAGGLLATLGTLAAILMCTLAPSLVYAAMAPDHEPFVKKCGSIKTMQEKHGALLSLKGAHPKKKALFFEDPLCPTCKSLHERLAAAGVLENLDATLALFPLDSECNWMLEQSLHPGACQVSRAILCAETPGTVLDWAYANQDDLAQAGRSGQQAVTQRVKQAFGEKIARCMNSTKTTQTLNRHLHFATDNAILVSTPQVFIENQRLCDEDIDIGLLFALNKLAPEVLE